MKEPVNAATVNAASRRRLPISLSAVRWLSLVILLASSHCYAAQRTAPGANHANSELQRLFESQFVQWDRNHDGKLDTKEINALVENPKIRGAEAAAIAVVRRHLQSDDDVGESQSPTLEQLRTLADEPAIQREFSGTWNHIQFSNRALFLAADPNLFTFHQGKLADCFLLSVIGTMINRSPQSVRAMIQPLPANAYQVHFASGKNIQVPALTDCELVMGADAGRDHGIWLNILEKAYASIREQKQAQQSGIRAAPGDAVPRDFLSGGSPARVIQEVTGHRTANAPLARWHADDAQKAPEKLHDLLIQLTRDRRLIAAATGSDPSKALPKGFKRSHAFGVLAYEPNRRMVKVFNPWGNDVFPVMPPGLTNGYATRHGVFEVPVKEFVQIFAGLSYEMDR